MNRKQPIEIASMIILFFVLFATNVNPTYAQIATPKITILIDGKEVHFANEVPFIDANGRTQVPFRIALEAFDAEVSWDDTSKTAIAKKGGIKIEVPIGKSYIYRNGVQIQNDTVAMVIGGKTFLPINSVFTALGGKVVWNQSKRAVEVTSQVTSQATETIDPVILNLADKLKEKVIIKDDLTLFTLYAFLNHTGYDEENNDKGFHEVRKSVREDLKAMNLQLADNQYYNNKKISYYQYKQALSCMDNDFNWKSSLPNYLSALSDLDVHLKAFSEKADIKTLYAKYKPYYDIAAESYSSEMYLALAKTIHFLRIDEESVPTFYFTVNLLDSYYRGNGLGTTYAHLDNKKMIMTGPSDTPNIINVVHEFLHGFLTPICQNNQAKIEQITYLRDTIPFDSPGLSSYQQFSSIVDESFVRALSGMFLEKPEQTVSGETSGGFVYTKIIYDAFVNDYPSYTGTLDQFIVKIIDDLNVK